ncbi:hypothetical protein COT64_00130 [Candidatus Shapirobacteria bacterium CG09_land_8_20_14_0_10_39_12]|uniref:Uncharacterized protein n=1 Tax=Candidatus Shapirobacteria bacterium CG09_land_8_20_14_0_10_39_12 TaxID=1974885 RepID=A0A2H0WQL4_9BACT|nr:MAG: hypothetical protein COT64_00130 [Candidatus Shapirobacteria bacterium CG09_land_8_20_14_0_10_39_12]
MKRKKPVVSQEQIDRESDAAWKEYKKQQMMEAEKEMKNERICLCGHSHGQHYGGKRCEICDCSHFREGVVVEDYKEINLGDSPGGFKIYE